jgi:DNA-binding NarL/FixJ family response regulator
MIRIVIADDHAIVRAGLKQMFAIMPDMEVIAEAIDGESVLETLRNSRNDILLLDLNMPGISGPDLIARVRAHWPKQPVLVLSMHDTAQIASRALNAYSGDRDH